MTDIPASSLTPFHVGFALTLIMTWLFDNALDRSEHDQQNYKLHRWLFIILTSVGCIAFGVGSLLGPQGIDLLLGSPQNISSTLLATIGTTGLFIAYMAGNYFRMTYSLEKSRDNNKRGQDVQADKSNL